SDWLGLLSLVACPVPRPTAPACLDADANGETPARTTAVKVGQNVQITFTLRNAGPGASPPITLQLFTFDPPGIGEFLAVVDCRGCAINSTKTVLEWAGVAPGDHVLTATLRAIGHPTDGPMGGTMIGDDYEWLAGFFALPMAAVLGGPDG